jgi:hypothetical protein
MASVHLPVVAHSRRMVIVQDFLFVLLKDAFYLSWLPLLPQAGDLYNDHSESDPKNL